MRKNIHIEEVPVTDFKVASWGNVVVNPHFQRLYTKVLWNKEHVPIGTPAECN